VKRRTEKGLIMKGVVFLTIALYIFLAGCSSEIDKCVDAGVKSASMNYPNMSEAEKASIERSYRIACLRAQAGK
jgi:hypothetical protein